MSQAKRIFPLMVVGGLAACAPTLEFRAEVTCTPGQARLVTELGHQQICVSPDDLIQDRDVVSISEVKNAPLPDDLGITFDKAAQQRFYDFTRANVMKRFAIMVDGKVIVAPTILEPIQGGTAHLSLTPESRAALLKIFHDKIVPQ